MREPKIILTSSVEPEERSTGYEGKTLKAVVDNWLYHPVFHERISAGNEVRKRFLVRFPRPDWFKEA